MRMKMLPVTLMMLALAGWVPLLCGSPKDEARGLVARAKEGPSLLLTREMIPGVKKRIAEDRDANDWFDSFRHDLDLRMAKKPEIYDRGGQWVMWLNCRKCATRLVSESPTRHVCPGCGEVHSGWPYDDAYISKVNNANGHEIRDCGVAWLLTGERKYADRVRDMLMAYARVYGGYEWHQRNGPEKPGRCSAARAYAQVLDEAVWLCDVLDGYDAVKDAFTDDERTFVLEKLIKPSTDTVRSECCCWSNHEVWHLAAFGRAGLVLGDASLVEAAIYGKYGAINQLKNGILADGTWYEGSMHYHFYTMRAFTPFFRVLRNLGYEVPADYRRMFLGPIAQVAPDGMMPPVNDSCSLEYLRPGDLPQYYEYANAWWDDGVLRWWVRQQPRRSMEYALWGRTEEAKPATPPSPASQICEGSGLAVLRSRTPGKAGGWIPDNCLMFDFGPHGEWHGHPDKLNIFFWLHDELVAEDPGGINFGSARHWGWYKSTLAHNELRVDGVNQGMGEAELVAFATNGNASAVAAFCSGAKPATNYWNGPVYKGVDVLRATALAGDVVLDYVEADSEQEHDYEWCFHARGELTPPEGTDLQPMKGIPPAYVMKSYDCPPLLKGDESWAWVENPRQGAVADVWRTSWKRPGGTLGLWQKASRPGVFATGVGSALPPPAKLTLAVNKVRGKRATFASVMVPDATAKVVIGEVFAHSDGTCGFEATVNGVRHRLAVRRNAKAAIEIRVASVPPLNEAGQPPMPLGEIGWGPKMFHYLPEAGIRHSRLHDTGGAYGGGKFVDITNLFRDFAADENNPGNYDFTLTDELVKAMVTNGVAPFFRLGETIENHAHIRRYRTFVPADKAKWARICEHVIRHYNEGWANGFRFGIEYWEIWNEPDFTTESWNPMWSGTAEDFYDLYEIAARHLKQCFPNLKVGGYGSCGFWAITSDERAKREGKDERSAERKAQEEYHVTFFRNFLKRVKERKIPFDFFTFHSYSPVGDILRQVEWCGDTMKAEGLGEVELNLDEWLPAPSLEKLGTARQAAEIAAVLAGATGTRLGRAMIYDARCGIGNYSPLFNPMTYRPHKAYYSFVAYEELRKLGRLVESPATPEGVYVAAATDGGNNSAVLVANVSGKPWRTTLDFGDRQPVEARVIDERRTYESAAWPVEIADGTVWLLKLRKRSADVAARKPMWPGFTRGMGFGGWLTNYKRFNVLPEDRRLPITEGDLEHFDTYLTEADVARVAAWGFDHVRVGFDQIVLEERPGVWRERTFRRLDDFIGWCEKHGLNVVLNLHKAVGNYCDIAERRQLLDDSALQERFLALWLEIERRYHDRPWLAFELLNEVRDVDPAKWNALADRAIRALRKANPDRWIVIGPTCWNDASALPKLKVWDDPKVVYTFHMYWPNEFTHQRGVLQWHQLAYNRELEYPSANVARYADYYRLHGWPNPFADGKPIDRTRLAKYLEPAFEFVRAHPDKILWNGEFGTIRHAPPASRVAYMRDVISLCREHGIPWCVWNYLSTPNDGNRFSLVDDDTREFLSAELLQSCLGLSWGQTPK